MLLVSVIIPCYNQALFLRDSLQSVYAQTHSNWECVIVDDGSTDHTKQVALEWVNRDKRFRYLYQENGGLSSARNAGLDNVVGSYIQFLDADDWIVADKWEKQLAVLQAMPAGTVAISDHFPFDNSTGEFLPRMYVSPFLNAHDFKKEVITEWEFRRSIPPHSPLIPASLVQENELRFTESLPTHEDWVFWCKLFYFTPHICFQQEQLACFRMRSDSMSNNKQKMAEGFLAATFVLETFYHQLNETEYIRCVRKIRKEVKNNLFPFSTSKKIYSAIAREAKHFLRITE